MYWSSVYSTVVHRTVPQAALVAVILLATGHSEARAHLPETGAITFYIHDDPADPESDVVYVVNLTVKADKEDGESVGWIITKAEIRKPDSGGPDQVWIEESPTVNTPDGLWWIDHDDHAAPKLEEFVLPPSLDGTADAQNPSDPDLEYDLEGVTYVPPRRGGLYAITGALTYSFTMVGQTEPDDSGDDEPVELPEGENDPY